MPVSDLPWWWLPDPVDGGTTARRSVCSAGERGEAEAIATEVSVLLAAGADPTTG